MCLLNVFDLAIIAETFLIFRGTLIMGLEVIMKSFEQV